MQGPTWEDGKDASSKRISMVRGYQWRFW